MQLWCKNSYPWFDCLWKQHQFRTNLAHRTHENINLYLKCRLLLTKKGFWCLAWSSYDPSFPKFIWILRSWWNPQQLVPVWKYFKEIWKLVNPCRSSHRRCSLRKGVFRNLPKFTGEHMYQSLFLNKVAALPATLLKKSLWHWCFPVNFAKFLRKPFYRTPPGDCFCPCSLYWYEILEYIKTPDICDRHYIVKHKWDYSIIDEVMKSKYCFLLCTR